MTERICWFCKEPIENIVYTVMWIDHSTNKRYLVHEDPCSKLAEEIQEVVE